MKRIAFALLAISLLLPFGYSRGRGSTPRSGSSRSAPRARTAKAAKPAKTRKAGKPAKGAKAAKPPGMPKAKPAGRRPPSGARCAACTRARDGRIRRSRAATRDFQKTHPCPSTGRTSGACPGYVIDHVVALKHGGADAPGNMQWQTIAAAKAKDKIE